MSDDYPCEDCISYPVCLPIMKSGKPTYDILKILVNKCSIYSEYLTKITGRAYVDNMKVGIK